MNKKSPLLLSISLSGSLIALAIFHKWNLDVLQKIVSIFGSLSLLVALAAYLYKKNQDNTIAALEQVTFFRNEIIPEWESSLISA
jgi:hypothetical protein